MIVYVETNFLLEVAYQQEEHGACATLLTDAARGALDLRVPAFAIAEARLTWRRRAAERTELQQRLQGELRELTRSTEWADLRSQSAALVSALVDSGEAARRRLEAAISEVTTFGRILPLDAETIVQAFEAEDRLSLSAPDALVYAAVVRDAIAADEEARARVPKCFLNRNRKDFDSPDVRDELRSHGCRVLASFADGEAYVRAVGRFPS